MVKENIIDQITPEEALAILKTLAQEDEKMLPWKDFLLKASSGTMIINLLCHYGYPKL